MILTDAPRFALYFVPDASSALARFGTAVLGYDIDTGTDTAYEPALLAAFSDWETRIREPQRYGFHATLKAPFRLAADASPQVLSDMLARFAEHPRQIPVVDLEVRRLGRFVALVPQAPCPALDALAADGVTFFDHLRAPPDAAETARRLAATLDDAEREYLARWGYPYVFDRFRFHMTLTGPLPEAEVETVAARLAERFAASCPSPRVAIDAVALCVQPAPDARFVVTERRALRASDAPPSKG